MKESWVLASLTHTVPMTNPGGICATSCVGALWLFPSTLTNMGGGGLSISLEMLLNRNRPLSPMETASSFDVVTNRLQLVKCSINDSNLVPKSKTRKRTQQDSCVSRSATTLLYIYSSYWATTTTPLPQPLHLCIKLTSFSLSSYPTGPTSFVWIDPACAPGRRPHDFD